MHLFGRQVVIYTGGSPADRPVCIKPPEKDFCNVSPTICSDLWTFTLVNNAADALKCQVLNSLEHYGDGIRVEEETASITLPSAVCLVAVIVSLQDKCEAACEC